MPILQIRDEDGNFIPIPAIKGDKGKSAYEQAKEGGYKGTEEEFIAILNGLTFPEDAEHREDFNNPHKVTASQVKALSLTGGTLTGKSVYFNNGNARITGAQDYIQLDVFDSSKDDENKRQLVLNGKNTTDLKDAVVLTTLENNEQNTYAIYGEHNVDELGISKIATGSYTGNNEESKIIPLNFTPDAVLVICKGTMIRYDSGLSLSSYYGGLATTDNPVIADNGKQVLSITNDGFNVYHSDTTSTGDVRYLISTNGPNVYNYIAIKKGVVSK